MQYYNANFMYFLFIAAEKDFTVVKEHIKQQGSVDVLSLKSFLVGPSRVGKTTTLRRLTEEIDHLLPNEIVPSTGIEEPLTVQLYHYTEQSSVLISEGWKSQGLNEQCQALCSCILKPSSSSRRSTTQQSASTSLKKSPVSEKQSASVESSKLPSLVKQSSSVAPSEAETMISNTDIVSSSIPSPSSTTSASQSKQASPSTATQDEITSALDLLVKKRDWKQIRAFLKVQNFTLINIVDIGGQPEFHEILPLLMHGLAFSMLFFDMTQGLDSKCEVIYRVVSGSCPIEYESEYTHREIIQRALHSISSLQPGANYSKPAAILVGTHHDKCSEADVSALEQSVQKAFANFIEDGVLCSVSKPGEKKKRYIHPVNNVSGDFSDIQSLRELITTVVHDRFKPEPVPTSTLLLHLILRMKFDPTPGWCSVEECVEIAERCGISREDLLKKNGILQYLHNRFGTILHYHPPLKISQRVIVNTNLIMRPPSKLFMTAFGTIISERTTAERIRETGEIPHRLMKKVCSSSKGQSPATEIPTDEIVELLNSQYILYENAKSATCTKEKFYFLPCLLCPYREIEDESQDPSHLNSLTYPPILLIPETGYVPLGPFPATVVKLSQSSHWTLVPHPRYRNRIRFSFQLPREHTLVVELRALSTHLEFRICEYNSSKPDLIKKCLSELIECFKKVLSFYPHTRERKWDFGFYCPYAIKEGKSPHRIPCKIADEPPDIYCSQKGCKIGTVDLEDKHKCWFIVSMCIIHSKNEV